MSDLVAIAYPDVATAQEVAGNVARLRRGMSSSSTTW